MNVCRKFFCQYLSNFSSSSVSLFEVAQSLPSCVLQSLSLFLDLFLAGLCLLNLSLLTTNCTVCTVGKTARLGMSRRFPSWLKDLNSIQQAPLLPAPAFHCSLVSLSALPGVLIAQFLLRLLRYFRSEHAGENDATQQNM